MVTMTDGFCGAGGSSLGAKRAGVHVATAIDYWPLALATHQINNPETEHYCVDLQKTHPRQFKSTDMLWMSPVCTHHSPARGKSLDAQREETELQGAEEKSRETMFEVVKFAAYHKYPVVMVENVVEVHHWQYFGTWLKAMVNLGYQYKLLYLNSQFFGAPQSRDRFYAVFWQGVPAPDLDYQPSAECPNCGAVKARQAWKNGRTWGKYKTQYVYKCPSCHREVTPHNTGADSIIDWSLDAPKVKDRKKPLAPKTLERIEAGIRKFGKSDFAVDTTFSHAPHNGKIRPAWAFVAPLRGTNIPHAVDEPMKTVLASGVHHSLVTSPFVMGYYGSAVYSAIDAPVSMITNAIRHELVNPFVLTHRMSYQVPDADISEIVQESGFRMFEPHELKLAQAFPSDYVLLGNKRDQVKQIGGAVTASVAHWIIDRCKQSLM